MRRFYRWCALFSAIAGFGIAAGVASGKLSSSPYWEAALWAFISAERLIDYFFEPELERRTL